VLLKQPNIAVGGPPIRLETRCRWALSGNRIDSGFAWHPRRSSCKWKQTRVLHLLPQSGTVGFAVGSENPREEFSLRKVEVKLDHREATVAEFHWVVLPIMRSPGRQVGGQFYIRGNRAHAFRVTPSVQLSPWRIRVHRGGIGGGYPLSIRVHPDPGQRFSILESIKQLWISTCRDSFSEHSPHAFERPESLPDYGQVSGWIVAHPDRALFSG